MVPKSPTHCPRPQSFALRCGQVLRGTYLGLIEKTTHGGRGRPHSRLTLYNSKSSSVSLRAPPACNAAA